LQDTMTNCLDLKAGTFGEMKLKATRPRLPHTRTCRKYL
jgi:hypothetical protein